MKLHAGFLLATLLGIATPVLAAEGKTAQKNNVVEALLNRHIQAVGGRDELSKIHSQISSFEMQEGDQALSVEVGFKDGKVYFEAKAGSGAIVRRGYSGQGRGWIQGPDGVREFDDARFLLEMRQMGLCLSPAAILDLKKHFSKLEVQGRERVGSRDCEALEATTEDGQVLKLLFDGETGLLTKVGTSLLEDYRLEGMIKVPHSVQKSSGVLKLKTIKFDPVIEESRFSKPSSEAMSAAGGQGEEARYETRLNPGTELGVVRRPRVAEFGRGPLAVLPVYRPGNQAPFQVDLRGCDLSRLSMTNRLPDLLHADFDSKTVWPASLPAGFDPENIMILGKNPGLGVRELHRKGITGKGIGLAIIDQALLVGHCEYQRQLRSYEEVHWPVEANTAQMHGPAVASIAVGKTVGVAPGADLYYIAEMHGVGSQRSFVWDFTWLANSIDRILEINAALPKERKIRVVSVSVGWMDGQKGSKETDAAVERATKAGVFVISTALERTHNLGFHGLGRDPMADPEKPGSFGPGSWWAGRFLSGEPLPGPAQRLLLPMDARTTASPGGEKDYVFYANGGWSWCVPYVAGLYALACEVRPDLTPEMFWETALRTGRTVSIEHSGKELKLGPIVNPVALIDSLGPKRD